MAKRRTGEYVLVMRDGVLQPVDIVDVTEAEIDELAQRYPDAGWWWAKILLRLVRRQRGAK